MRKIISLLIIISLMMTFSFAIDSSKQKNTNNRGLAGFQFLKLPATATHIALGEANFAENDDASSIFMNVAEMVDYEGNSLYFNQQKLYDNLLTHLNIGLTTKLTERIALGFFARSLTTEDIEITTLDDPDGTDITYSYQDLALGTAFAYKATKRFSFGLKAKYVSESIYNTSASTFLFDLATQYDIEYANIQITTLFENYGPATKFEGNDLWRSTDFVSDSEGDIPSITNPDRTANLNTKEFSAPTKITIGISMDLLGNNAFYTLEGDNKVRMYTAMAKPSDSRETGHLGLKYEYTGLTNTKLSLYSGYKYYQEEDYDNELSFGAGIDYKISKNFDLGANYSYKNHESLEQSQVFSLSLNF